MTVLEIKSVTQPPRKEYLRVESFAQLIRAGILVVLANVVFFALVLIVNASIDHDVLFDKVSTAASNGMIDDQDYPAGLATYSDRFTDCVAIGLNLGGSPHRSSWEFIRDTEVPRIEGLGACPSLVRMLTEKRNVPTANYGRYWHGYQIFSKPFLYLSDVRHLRYIFASLAVIAVMLFSVTISIAYCGARGAYYGVWFAAGYILLTDGADLANVFTHSISLFTIFLAPTIAFWALRAGYKQQLFLIAVTIGCVNAFFDLLFNPPLGLSALIIGTAAGLADEDLSARDIMRVVLLITFGFCIGFFGTYVCRFAIAAFLSDNPLATLEEIFTAGLFRVSGIEEKIRSVFFWATIKNFGYPMLRPSFVVFMMITGAMAALLWRSFHQIRIRPEFLALLAPTLVSVLWFEILRNHSQHHHWFTYRSASFSLVCLAAFVIFGMSPPTKLDRVRA
jgi:hypothetical protein